MNILDYKDRHKGEEIFILCNGMSLLEQLPDLRGDDVCIGLNASLAHWPSRYQIALDTPSVWRLATHEHKPEVLFCVKGMTDDVTAAGIPMMRIQPRYNQVAAWSDDLVDCIYPCRATMWAALQIAGWMGAKTIKMLGFDLEGVRIPGHVHEGLKLPASTVQRQLQLAGFMKGLIKAGAVDFRVYNCNEDSFCEVFPYLEVRGKDEPWRYEKDPSDIMVKHVTVRR